MNVYNCTHSEITDINQLHLRSAVMEITIIPFKTVHSFSALVGRDNMMYAEGCWLLNIFPSLCVLLCVSAKFEREAVKYI